MRAQTIAVATGLASVGLGASQGSTCGLTRTTSRQCAWPARSDAALKACQKSSLMTWTTAMDLDPPG